MTFCHKQMIVRIFIQAENWIVLIIKCNYEYAH